MNSLPLASVTSLLVLGTFATLLLGTILIVSRLSDPFRRLAQFRVSSPSGLRFRRLAYATIGDAPNRRAWYRNTLSFALDQDWVYLRLSRLLPFFPAFWRLPRNQVRLQEHEYWSILISAADPPLNADLGSSFIAAFREL